MPTVTKQTTKPPTPNSRSNGSVLARAVPVSEIADDWIKIAVYGKNRTGKTTLACQFPKPLLLIACDPNQTGGAKSVKKVPGVEYIKMESVKDLASLAVELRDPNARTPKGTRAGDIKTHVLDTATSIQDMVLQDLLDLPAIPEQLDWGTATRDQYRARSEKTRELLRLFLNLQANTVVLAQEKDHNPPDRDKPEILRGSQAESFFASDLGGATVGWLHDACDYICRLYLDKETKEVKRQTKLPNGKVNERVDVVETGKIVRRLRTLYHPNFAAGFRTERPQDIPEYLEDPTFEKINRLIRGA